MTPVKKLDKGPMPYSTHDLHKLFDAQLHARLIIGDTLPLTAASTAQCHNVQSGKKASEESR